MINVSNVTQALKTILNDNVNIKEFLKGEVVVGEFVNADPNQAPWIGIYRGDVRYEPRTLGRGSDEWQATLSLRILVQNTHLSSGEECEKGLEGYVKHVLDAVWSDPTISNTVDMVNGFNIEYTYSEIDRRSLHFQSAVITVELEVKTS